MFGFSFVSKASESSFFGFFGKVVSSDLCVRILSFLFVLYLGWFFLSWSFFFDEILC